MDVRAQVIELRERLFDAPLDAGVRDELLVLGDVLESKGDPLGRRIALSEGLFVEADRAARASLRRELSSFTAAESRELFGPIAPLLRYRRALDIEWRGGAPLAVMIDTRHITKLAKLEPDELVGLALQAPVLQPMRRLWIRLRNYDRHSQILDAVAAHRPRFNLEELLIGTNPRPARIQSRPSRQRYHPQRSPAMQYAEDNPSLWLLSASWSMVSLPPRWDAIEWSFEDIANELRELGKPTSAAERAHIGRGLWSPDPGIRAAAAQVVSRHDLVGAFAPTLRLLLRPNVCELQDEIIEALGKAAAPIAPLLNRITGSVGRYEPQVRSAAGRVLGQIRKENS